MFKKAWGWNSGTEDGNVEERVGVSDHEKKREVNHDNTMYFYTWNEEWEDGKGIFAFAQSNHKQYDSEY